MHPTFMIIGPPKCGSTSLHFYLGQHHDVFVSEPKETNFFSDDYDKGIEFYKHYFKNAGNAKAIGEATPTYSFLPFVSARIKKHYPDTKFIFCFRNPMERAFSEWLMLWDAGVEKTNFRTAVEMNVKQMSHVNFDDEAGAAIWKNRPNTIQPGEGWIRTYLYGGMYAKALKNYLELFGEDNIKVIFLEELSKNFDAVISDIFAFIGVDANFILPEKEEQNFYYDRKFYRTAVKVLGVKNARFLSKKMSKNFKKIFKQKKASVKAVPKLNYDDRIFLWSVFKDDVAELEKLTNRNLSHWNPANKINAEASLQLSNR